MSLFHCSYHTRRARFRYNAPHIVGMIYLVHFRQARNHFGVPLVFYSAPIPETILRTQTVVCYTFRRCSSWRQILHYSEPVPE
jgi:hypothetical protein